MKRGPTPSGMEGQEGDHRSRAGWGYMWVGGELGLSAVTSHDPPYACDPLMPMEVFGATSSASTRLG